MIIIIIIKVAIIIFITLIIIVQKYDFKIERFASMKDRNAVLAAGRKFKWVFTDLPIMLVVIVLVMTMFKGLKIGVKYV